jgi:hypothetical protein
MVHAEEEEFCVQAYAPLLGWCGRSWKWNAVNLTNKKI